MRDSAAGPRLLLARPVPAPAAAGDPSPAGKVEGSVAPGYEPVLEAFRLNVELRGDTGASCAVYRHGRLVVDLWSATADEQPWSPEMRSCVFSVSKGVTTICVLMAADQGLLVLDAPVADYWPEFAAHGKERITVRQLLAHRAGLVAPDVDFSTGDVQNWRLVTAALAGQRPSWPPGSAYAYHALTFGWLVGEVLRRATGMRPSEWLRTRVSAPLGLAMTFGDDPTRDDVRPMLAPLPTTDERAASELAGHLSHPLVLRSLSLGGAIDPLDLFGSFNRPELLAAEIPGGNLVTNARSLARLYAATVGTVDAVQLLTPAAVADACRVQSQGRPFMGPDEGHLWGTGFMLASPRRRMAGAGSFGHDGAGGQLAFAHTGHEIGFGYQTSRPGGIPDDRAEELCRALRTCL